MLFIRGLLVFALLALWIYSVVEVTTSTRSECRTLPKAVWLALVVLLPVVGALLWLATGRPRAVKAPAPSEMPVRPSRDVPANPDDDDEFLRGLRDRAEQQRRAADRQRREAERRAAEEEKRRRTED